jgi:hypothetical protein
VSVSIFEGTIPSDFQHFAAGMAVNYETSVSRQAYLGPVLWFSFCSYIAHQYSVLFLTGRSVARAAARHYLPRLQETNPGVDYSKN